MTEVDLDGLRARIAAAVVEYADHIGSGRHSVPVMDVLALLSDLDRLAGSATVGILARASHRSRFDERQ